MHGNLDYKVFDEMSRRGWTLVTEPSDEQHVPLQTVAGERVGREF